MRQEVSGLLHQRVRLEVPMDSADGGGGFVRTWIDAGEYWAQVQPLARDKHRHAGHVATVQRFAVLIRRDADVPLSARLHWAGRVLTITSVVDDPETPHLRRIMAEQEREA